MKTDTQTEHSQIDYWQDKARQAHAQADKLAEALRKVRTCASLPDAVMQLVRQALAEYEASKGKS